MSRREGEGEGGGWREGWRNDEGVLVLCNALAVPLANLFAFLARGHPQCTFVDQAHLALYADLQFNSGNTACLLSEIN